MFQGEGKETEPERGEIPFWQHLLDQKGKLIKFNFDPICVRSIYESILH